MPRVRVHIDPEEFQAIVNGLESLCGFNSPTALWNAVAATRWNKSNGNLSARSIRGRAEEMRITYKTRMRRAKDREDEPSIVQTERVTYLYRMAYKEKGRQGIQCRDVRLDWRIVTKQDVKKTESVLRAAKLISWEKIRDD
jgi:hypothetical protein